MNCQDCGQEMLNADTCTMNTLVIAGKDGQITERYQRSTYHFDEPTGRCHDCGIKHGGIHHWGCDVERCPKCGLQLISCDCFAPDGVHQLDVQVLTTDQMKKYSVPAPVQPVPV